MAGPEKNTAEAEKELKNFSEVQRQAYEQHQQQQQRYAQSVNNARVKAGKAPRNHTFGNEIARQHRDSLQNLLDRLQQQKNSPELQKALAFAGREQKETAPKLENYTKEEFDELDVSQQFSLHLAEVTDLIYGKDSVMQNLQDYLQSNDRAKCGECLMNLKQILDRLDQPEKAPYKPSEPVHTGMLEKDPEPGRPLRQGPPASKLDRCLFYEESDQTWFRELYAMLKDLQLETDSLSDGRLMVPARGNRDMDNRYFIRVNDGRQNVKPVPGGNIIHDSRLVKQPRTVDVTGRIDNARVNLDVVYVQYPDYEKIPLFTHMPVPEDVLQGRLGDCYMMASLCSLAAEDPEKIMDAMHDNGDGTVTVRFFDAEDTPVFVTVDKSVPHYRIPVNGGDDIYQEAYAKENLWVQMFEKAYAASGLQISPLVTDTKSIPHGVDPAVPKEKEAEASERVNIKGYDGIDGGLAVSFLPCIVGHKTRGIKEEAERMSMDRIRTGQPGNYSQGELQLFEKIQNSLKKGSYVTCSTTVDMTGSSIEGKGIVGGHFYTVLGAVPGKHGKNYIRVRNPHATYGREYDKNGRPVYVEHPKNPGESLIELHDFVKTFMEVNLVRCSTTPEVRANAGAIETFRRTYGKAAMDCCQKIMDVDNSLMNLFRMNREKYGPLRTAAVNFRMAYNAPAPDLHQMEQTLQELVRCAGEYKNYRDEHPRSAAKESGTRAAARYHAADMLVRLGAIMQREAVRPVYEHSEISADLLTRQTLSVKEEVSCAKQCADQRFTEALQKAQEVRTRAQDDFMDLKDGAQQQMKQAVAANSSKGFVSSCSGIVYFDAGLKGCGRLPDSRIDAMRTQKTAVTEIHALEPHIKTLCRSLTKEETKELLSGKEPDRILAQAEKKLQDAQKRKQEASPEETRHRSRTMPPQGKSL